MPRHRLDPLSLIAGGAFVLIGLAALIDRLDVRHVGDDWLLPVALLVAALGVLASLRMPPAPAAVEPLPDVAPRPVPESD